MGAHDSGCHGHKLHKVLSILQDYNLSQNDEKEPRQPFSFFYSCVFQQKSTSKCASEQSI